MASGEFSSIVKSFVAGTLGCRCPESVFGQIDYDANSAILGPDVPLQRLLVGNRLLIYILDCQAATEIQTLLPQLLEKGKEERDRCAYNRLRIVVSTTHPGSVRQEAEPLFSALVGPGEKVHLHVLAGCRSLERVRDLMTDYDGIHV